jgi:hypothetical protein
MKTISSYAASYRASHPKGTPASLSPGRDGFGQPQEEDRQRAQERVPATAALQRRLWASSTVMPPVTDVFQSESFAFGLGGDDRRNVEVLDQHEEENDDANGGGSGDGGENAGELQFDLSEQAAAVASSVARARGAFTASYYSSERQEEREQHQMVAESDYLGEGLVEDNDHQRQEEELAHGHHNVNHHNDFEHTYSHYSGSHNIGAPHNNSAPEAVAKSTAAPAAAAAELAAELEKERRVNSVLLKQLQEAQERAAMATAAAASVPAMENIEPGDFSGVLAALQHERLRNTELGQQAQRAAEAQLTLEVELASAQRENAITRARCRALERQSPLAHIFAQCEAAVKNAEDKAQRLQKENFDLARAVSEAELSSLVKSAINKEDKTNSSDTSAVIATLHKKLNVAHSQIRKLQAEVAGQQAKACEAESSLRSADVNRRTAEDAIRRNSALQEALTAAEARFEEQCLAAAEALAAAEELQRERDEYAAALEAEQERGDQLLDLAESYKLRAQVGAAHAYNNTMGSEGRSHLMSATPGTALTSGYP